MCPTCVHTPDLMFPSSRMTPPHRAYCDRLLSFSRSLSPSLFNSSRLSLIFSQLRTRNTRCFRTKFLQSVRLILSTMGHVSIRHGKVIVIGFYLSLLDIGFIRRCWKNLLLSLDSSSWGQKIRTCVLLLEDGGKKEEKKNNTFDSRMFITSHTRFLRWCFDLRFSFSLPSLRAPPPDPPALPGRPLSR